MSFLSILGDTFECCYLHTIILISLNQYKHQSPSEHVNKFEFEPYIKRTHQLTLSSTLSTWNDYSRAYSGLPMNYKYLLYVYVYYKAEPEKLFQSVQELQKCLYIQIWAHSFPCVLLGPKIQRQFELHG